MSINIFEPEMPEIKFTGGEHALQAYLRYFSKYFENDQKKNDLSKVNELSNSRLNTSPRVRKSSLFQNLNPRKSSIQAYNTDNKIDMGSMEKLGNILKSVDSFEFNVFELDKIVGRKTIFYTVNEVFERYSDLINLVDEKKFKNFLNYISDNYYRNNPYHNDLHAADVFQTTYVIMIKGNIVDVLNPF